MLKSEMRCLHGNEDELAEAKEFTTTRATAAAAASRRLASLASESPAQHQSYRQCNHFPHNHSQPQLTRFYPQHQQQTKVPCAFKLQKNTRAAAATVTQSENNFFRPETAATSSTTTTSNKMSGSSSCSCRSGISDSCCWQPARADKENNNYGNNKKTHYCDYCSYCVPNAVANTMPATTATSLSKTFVLPRTLVAAAAGQSAVEFEMKTAAWQQQQQQRIPEIDPQIASQSKQQACNSAKHSFNNNFENKSKNLTALSPTSSAAVNRTNARERRRHYPATTTTTTSTATTLNSSALKRAAAAATPSTAAESALDIVGATSSPQTASLNANSLSLPQNPPLCHNFSTPVSHNSKTNHQHATTCAAAVDDDNAVMSRQHQPHNQQPHVNACEICCNSHSLLRISLENPATTVAALTKSMSSLLSQQQQQQHCRNLQCSATATPMCANTTSTMSPLGGSYTHSYGTQLAPMANEQGSKQPTIATTAGTAATKLGNEHAAACRSTADLMSSSAPALATTTISHTTILQPQSFAQECCCCCSCFNNALPPASPSAGTAAIAPDVQQHASSSAKINKSEQSSSAKIYGKQPQRLPQQTKLLCSPQQQQQQHQPQDSQPQCHHHRQRHQLQQQHKAQHKDYKFLSHLAQLLLAAKQQKQHVMSALKRLQVASAAATASAHAATYSSPKFIFNNSTFSTFAHNNASNNNNNKHSTTRATKTLSTCVSPLPSSSSSSSSFFSKSWLTVFSLLMLASSANCWAGRQDVPSNCTFPSRWEGSWFLSGYQQSIHIKGSQFSYRGKCAASDGNKYLIVDEKGCHRCLVIYEKHKNVLQYKESECEGDSMYMHQSNPSAMAMRSVLKQSDHRGGAHPNSNGHSRLSSSDQYIMRSNDDMNDYYCKGRETLQNLCDQIPGDALLYSLFRESTEPVKCPLKGPFIFTYNRGHGECKSPVSNIESCTEDSRLLLSFQACPDVQGTESTVEELTCLAAWKDGNSRYLVGLVSHHHAISNEERYRCFVYEKISSLMGGPGQISSKDAEYKLAQSGDATCNGLDSAEVGSRIMSLRKPPAAERCDFPSWFKGPRHWHALMGNMIYNYHATDGSVHIIKPNGYMETRALCEQINKQTSTEMMAVVHYTTGCQSGFMCMMFYRRDTHVIEVQTGQQATRLEDACAPDHFDINKMPYITLLASNPDPQICPMEGLYNLRGAIGPPYMSTRHKRNHNNHHAFAGHGHHHHQLQQQQQQEAPDEAASTHKRSLNSRSVAAAARLDKLNWHTNSRVLPARSRREAEPTTTIMTPHNDTALDKPRTAVNSSSAIQLPAASSMTFNASASQALSSATTAATAVLQAMHSTQSAATANKTSVAFIAAGRRRRDAPGCTTNYKAQRQLWVGCTDANIIDVRPLCTEEGDEEYSCHGSWTENGTVYIIARHKGTKHGVCISYRPTEGNNAKLVVGDACYRGTQKPPDHHLVADLSVFGKCGETGSGAAILNSWTLMPVVAFALTSSIALQLYGNLGR